LLQNQRKLLSVGHVHVHIHTTGWFDRVEQLGHTAGLISSPAAIVDLKPTESGMGSIRAGVVGALGAELGQQMSTHQLPQPGNHCPNRATHENWLAESGQRSENLDHVGQGGSGVGEAEPQDCFTITVGFLEVRPGLWDRRRHAEGSLGQ
jgi:hypothetical protein